MPERVSPADAGDLSELQAQWGTPASRPPLRARDITSLAHRFPLALMLASETMRDASACWIAINAIRRHRALQKPVELARYLRFLRQHRIERAMEIGTLWGGTFYAHCAIASPVGHLIAVDTAPGADPDRMTERFKLLARPTQRVTCIWSDSHAEVTRQQVAAALNGEQLDLLFIDGDHSDAGVHQDYTSYEPFVRSGGLIVLHDVAGARADGVPALWRSLKARHEHKEFIDRVSPPHGLGIGAVIKG